MINRLRLQLTILYPLVAFALIILLGGGIYVVVRYYMVVEYYPDIELEARMATEFERRNLALPFELQGAIARWEKRRPAASLAEGSLEDGLQPMIVDGHGAPVAASAATSTEVFLEGIVAAQKKGRDLRTGRPANGELGRFLTYRLPSEEGETVYIQFGRYITDQLMITNQLFGLLIGLGVFGALVSGLFSWWLAGRSLLPAQRAWENQQQFIANASHELHTPIALLRANAEVALRPATTPTRRQEILKDVVGECDRLSHIVEELLLLSRLDSKKVAFKKETLPVAAMMEEVVRQFSVLAAERKLSLECGSRVGTVLADRTWLHQVLLILLDNAIKFTPVGGSVRLNANQVGQWVTFTVEDSGVGITDEDLGHVFERFYQAGNTCSGSQEGNGLGLAIARTLVQAQGGSISIRSQVGQGTCVSVMLPGV